MKRLLALATILLASPPRADACSCGTEPPTVSPTPGANAVPTNAIVIVRYQYAFEPRVELRDVTTGQLVPISVDVRHPASSYFGTTVFARPVAPLAAATTYTVSATNDGYPTYDTTFTTGSATDVVAPMFDGIEATSLETMQYPIPQLDGSQCHSSCIATYVGHISRIRVDHAAVPADAVHVTLQVRTLDGPYGSETLLAHGYLGYETCGPSAPVLTADADYCARVVVYDVAGNASGLDREVCTNAVRCAPRGVDERACIPSDECVPIATADTEGGGGCASTRVTTLGGALPLALLAVRRRRR